MPVKRKNSDRSDEKKTKDKNAKKSKTNDKSEVSTKVPMDKTVKRKNSDRSDEKKTKDKNAKKSKTTDKSEVPTKVPVDKTDVLQVGDTIYLRLFPMETLNTHVDGKRVLIVGMSGSGKSTVALDILRFNKDIPVWMIVSPSESRNHTYSPHVHPLWVHDDLVMEEIQNFRKRQEQNGEKWQVPDTKPTEYYRDTSAGIIIDDCNIDPKMFKEDVFNWVYFNSRHDHVLVMMLTQYMMLVPIQHRRNLSHLFLFRQNSPKEIKKIYDEFAGVFPKLSDFRKALEICTADRRCMVIDVLSPSTRVQDRIFWYKAPKDQPYPFKAGQEWAWKQSDDLYDPNWKATHKRPIDSEGDGGSKKKQKTGDAPIKLLDENNAPLDL